MILCSHKIEITSVVCSFFCVLFLGFSRKLKVFRENSNLDSSIDLSKNLLTF